MKKNKKNCYEFGSFVKANSAGIGSAGQMATGVLEGFKNPNKANIGLGTAQGALSGASAGAALGPLGMLAGGVIGGAAGLISGIQQKKQIDTQRDATYGDLQGQQLGSMTTANINPYGTQTYADGGQVDPSYKKFYNNYLNSPNYVSRLVGMGYGDLNGVRKDRRNNLNTLNYSNLSGIGSQYIPETNKINIDSKELKKQGLNNTSTMAHEVSHAVGSMLPGSSRVTNKNLALNSKELTEINKRNRYRSINTDHTSKLPIEQRIMIDHDKLAPEAKANIDALRYKLSSDKIYDTGNQTFDKNHLKKAKEKYSTDKVLNRNFKAFKDDDLIWIMNNIALEGNDVNDKMQDGGRVASNSIRKPQSNIMLPNWDGMVQKADGSVGMWGNPLDSTRVKAAVPPLLTLGSTDHRGVRTGQKYQGTPATTNQIQMKEKLLRAQSSRNYYADGSDVEQNIINIEKGELQIDPNSGKILREFNGVNPETAGLYKPHNEKGKDTSNNFVTADPGTFIITKAKAKKYKDSVENNDKLAQQTILQNIRNYKSEVKGDKIKFADGSDVLNPFLSNKYLGTSAASNGNFQIPTAPYSFGQPTILSNQELAANPALTFKGVPTMQQAAGSTGGFLGANGYMGYSSPTVPFVTGQGANNTNQTTGNKLLNGITQYGPAAMNIARGLFGKVEQESRITANKNPYLNQIQANLPQDIDMQPIYNDIYSQGRTATNDIRNNSNSSAVFRANRQNLGANTQRQIAGARMQGDIANNQIRGQRASIYGSLGEQAMREQDRVRGFNFQIDQVNAQNRAAKSNLVGTGVSQVQEVYQNNKKNNQLYNMDMFKANLLPQIYTNLKYYQDTFGVDAINKLLKGQ